MKRMTGLLLALAVVVAASFAVAAQARPAGTASPAVGRNHSSADVTFTKSVTSLGPDPSTLAGAAMVGVVGGDIGEGTYAGMVVKDDTTSKPGFWLGQALYGFFGSEHSFVANNFITENDTVSPITATIRGVVIVSWMKGARVTADSPDLRLAVLKSGAKEARLRVYLNVTDDKGNPRTQKLKDLSGTDSWSFTDPAQVPWSGQQHPQAERADDGQLHVCRGSKGRHPSRRLAARRHLRRPLQERVDEC